MKIRIHFHRAGLIVLLTFCVSLSARGQDPDSVLSMARKLAAREEYSRALALVTDLNRAHPENQDYIIYLARLYYWSKDYSKSKERRLPYFNFFILAFAILVMLSYLALAIISSFSLKAYLQKNRYINYGALLALPHTPKVSLIAPAYNEGKTIRENVKSLLSIN